MTATQCRNFRMEGSVIATMRIPVLAGGIILGSLAAPAMAAMVSTGWASLPAGTNQDACLATGNAAVVAAGFRANISDDRQTVFGWRGDEALVVRCIADRNIAVVFAWVTDASNDSAPLVNGVIGAMRGGGQGGQPSPVQPGVKG